jgi:hypothetical protein
MAITGVIASNVIEALAKAWGGDEAIISYDVDSQADQEAVIDLDHAVYTTSQQNSDAQDSIGDNSNGLQDPMVLQPTISFSYTTGHTTSHEQTQGFTVGVTQDFDFKFAGSGEGTTISTSGTFSWTEGTSDNETTSVTNSISAPFNIPKGKIYEEKLFYTQEQVEVPYSAGVTATGSVTYEMGSQVVTIGNLFAAPSEGYPPPPMPGINWSDFSTSDYTTGRYVLTGTLTVYDGGQSVTKIYDITNPTSASAGMPVVEAEYDPTLAIGVHQTLSDTGAVFLDTPFDDWVDGGGGDDNIILRSGEEVVYAAGGEDRIEAWCVGRSILDGGAGNDVIRLMSNARFSEIQGGDGRDKIFAYAPTTMIDGGAGNDRFYMDMRSGGSVITDDEGRNKLHVQADGPISFEHVGNNLYILMDGKGAYDRTEDIVWVDFFSSNHNTVNGRTATEIDCLISRTPDPEECGASKPEPCSIWMTD